MFRTLYADEIDVRVGTVGAKGVSLLLYKDSRCDQRVLDESVGALNWQCHYSRDNANCTVSIWDEDKRQWIEKEDTGVESNTEAEKGLASDSFKRACVKWGIGRELYTAPFIFIQARTRPKQGGRGYELENKFEFSDVHVTLIEYSDARRITALQISDKYGKVIYSYGRAVKGAEKGAEEPTNISREQAIALSQKCHEKGRSVKELMEMFKVSGSKMSDITRTQYEQMIAHLEEIE